MTLPRGTVLATYEIVGHLGTGGMGEVYRARDSKLGREVALKMLPTGFSNDADAAERLAREARVLASLNHPNVATLYGFEGAGLEQFLVMELVEGDTLADRIAKGPIPLGDVLPLFRQVADGIDAAHASGIIHRDLKPANVKVLADQRVKVLDFGLAKALEADEWIPPVPKIGPRVSDLETEDGIDAFPFDALSVGPVPDSMTRTGAVMGTPGYMSPEQAFGDPVGKPTDAWAFGCCLFEALTGARAFSGDSFPQMVRSILIGQPDWTELDGVPAVLRDLVYDCLAKEPGERVSSFAEIRTRLEAADLEVPSAGHPAPPTPPDSLERRLFDMSRDILCAAGLDGFLKRVNPAFERALGWSAQELYARPFIDFVHPEDRSATLKEMEKLGQGISTFSFVNRWECKDGTFRALHWTAHLEPGTSWLYGVARFTSGVQVS